MNGRALTLVNSVGCLVLGLLLIREWRKELALDGQIQGLKTHLVAAHDQHAAARERAEMLEREQETLKESIKSMQQAAETTGNVLAERERRVAELEAQVVQATEQITTWQAAVSQRDESIRTLNADLASARRRLDEAIAKLKAAAAR